MVDPYRLRRRLLRPTRSPVNQVAPTIIGNGDSGVVHTVNPGFWIGNPPVENFVVRWFVNNVLRDLAASYIPSPADDGLALVARVMADNGVSPATTIDTAPVTINDVTAVAPTFSPNPTITNPSETVEGSLLIATWGVAGTEPITESPQWLRDDLPIPGATSLSGVHQSNYQTTAADVGSTIKFSCGLAGQAAPTASHTTAATGTITAMGADPVASLPYLMGPNVAGAEGGSNKPGTNGWDFQFPDNNELDHWLAAA